jgi:hypothetical protein
MIEEVIEAVSPFVCDPPHPSTAGESKSIPKRKWSSRREVEALEARTSRWSTSAGKTIKKNTAGMITALRLSGLSRWKFPSPSLIDIE